MALMVKNPPANAGDTREVGSIPGSGRSPGIGNGNPLQYSCLENSMDRGAWWAMVHGVIQSWARLNTKKSTWSLYLWSSQGQLLARSGGLPDRAEPTPTPVSLSSAWTPLACGCPHALHIHTHHHLLWVRPSPSQSWAPTHWSLRVCLSVSKEGNSLGHTPC